MFFSKSTCGFYSESIHGDRVVNGERNQGCKIPDDAVPITDNLYAELMAAQARGQRIQAGFDGLPVAVPPAAQTMEELAAATAHARAEAYRFEADPLFFKYQRGEASREQWLEKVAEIRKRYPDFTAASE